MSISPVRNLNNIMIQNRNGFNAMVEILVFVTRMEVIRDIKEDLRNDDIFRFIYCIFRILGFTF